MSYKPKIAYIVENLFNTEVDFIEKLKMLSEVELDRKKLIYFEECVEAFHPEYFIPHARIGERAMKLKIINKLKELRGIIKESKGVISTHKSISKMSLLMIILGFVALATEPLNTD